MAAAPLTDYATYEDIRAALGVTPEELEDATLALALYADNLQVELEDVDLSIPSTYVTVRAEVSPTEAQERFLQSCRLFSIYAVAKHLTDSVSLFAPKDVTDGKAAIARVTNPHKLVIENINKQYGRFRVRLDETFAALSSTSATSVVAVNYFSAVTPASDPVTGS